METAWAVMSLGLTLGIDAGFEYYPYRSFGRKGVKMFVHQSDEVISVSNGFYYRQEQQTCNMK